MNALKFAIVSVSLFSSCTQAPLKEASRREAFAIEASILNAASETFISHQGQGPYSNYLALVVPYQPVQAFVTRLERQIGIPLKTRGEAHITIVTPPEYDLILRERLTMQEIEALAQESDFQKSQYEIFCLGRGQAAIDGRLEQTYFLVVQSKALVNVRERIFRAYVAKGGEPSRFDPNAFYPHITVGFSRSDLHESQGIKKGVNSCISDVTITPSLRP